MLKHWKPRQRPQPEMPASPLSPRSIDQVPLGLGIPLYHEGWRAFIGLDPGCSRRAHLGDPGGTVAGGAALKLTLRNRLGKVVMFSSTVHLMKFHGFLKASIAGTNDGAVTPPTTRVS